MEINLLVVIRMTNSVWEKCFIRKWKKLISENFKMEFMRDKEF